MVSAFYNATDDKTSGRAVSLAQQKTLAEPVSVSGVGLHLGQQTTVRLLPAKPDEGRYFVRTDLLDSGLVDSDLVNGLVNGEMDLRIEADISHVVATQLSTELGAGKAQVRTVEHLLSALLALGLDNVRIEVDGPELPLLDGSALGWLAAIGSGLGVENQQLQSADRRRRSPVSHLVSVQDGDAWVTAYPSDTLRFTYGIDFDLPAIGSQWYSWSPGAAPGSMAFASGFAKEVASARTFGLAHQIDYLRSQGLIKGGSLENALVCGKEGWINPPLRFENEPARHKLLDLIGDLSLLGDIPSAHYVAYKASHALHVAIARKLEDSCLQLV